MDISVTADTDVVAVTLAGRFDAHCADEYDRLVISEIGPDRADVEIDLAGVEFMDSSALACLVRTLKACTASGGVVTLVAVSDPARIILELTRLDGVFPVVTDVSADRGPARIAVER